MGGVASEITRKCISKKCDELDEGMIEDKQLIFKLTSLEPGCLAFT